MALYIIPNAYDPGTAATNRILGLLEGINLAKLEVGTLKVVFFEPNRSEDRLTKIFNNLEVVNLWKVGDRRKPRYYFRLKTLFRQWEFRKQLRTGDSVLILGNPHLIGQFLNTSGIRIYHEMNEHPTVIPLGPRGQQISLEKYLSWCRNLDGLFVISNHLTDYFVENGVRREKIHLYKMIVDGSRFAGIEKKNVVIPYIAYCGTANNFKDGVDILLEAFALVKKKWNKPLQLYIIGKTPLLTERKGHLKLIDELGINEDVIFTGIITAQEMPQMLKNAECLVLARPDNIQAKYGFPTKLGEYLLTENPVVVTSVGDIPLYLQDGISALIAKPNDPESVAEKIIWSLNNKDDAMIIGQRGCEVAKKEFNPQIEAQRILDIVS